MKLLPARRRASIGLVMPSQPPHHRRVIVRTRAPVRTVVRRRRPASDRGGLLLAFVLTVGAFGFLLAALAFNNDEREADSAPRKPAATAESGTGYDRMLAEIVSRIKTSQSEDVLLANRATFHQEINDSTTLTPTQKESLRWEIIREVEARKDAMRKASFQR
jgi:hypothetical protein